MKLIKLLKNLSKEEKDELKAAGEGILLGGLVGACLGTELELIRYISHDYNPSFLKYICEVSYPSAIGMFLGGGIASSLRGK